MSRGRRALALGVLAALLGGLAASDVAEREAALEHGLGPQVSVVVARAAIGRGDAIGAAKLGVRRVPARFAPRGAFGATADVAGARAAGDIAAGGDLTAALLADAGSESAAALLAAGPGERIARIVAVGTADELLPGTRADVLITREGSGGRVSTRLALRGAQVVEAAPAAGSDGAEGDGLPRVALALRVSLGDAVLLTEAQAGARELRVLPRPPSALRRVP